MQLFAVVNPDEDRFVEVGFRSHGCLAAIACATVVADMLTGKTVTEALEITQDQILEAVDGLPDGRVYTLNFAIEAIRALVGDYYLRVKGYNLAQLDEVVPCERMCLNCIITENCSLRDERVDQELREAGEIE